MCNCRSCKPHRMHLHANSFNHNRQQYRSRALSASPSPPPIPPQPERYQSIEQIVSFDMPEPPPRRYQVIPIRNDSIQSSPNRMPSQNLISFGRTTSFNDRNHFRQNDYENTRDIIRPPILKDPRRKPYYYNELHQSVDANDNIDILNADLEMLKAESSNHLNDDKMRMSLNSMGSGGSLDDII